MSHDRSKWFLLEFLPANLRDTPVAHDAGWVSQVSVIDDIADWVGS